MVQLNNFSALHCTIECCSKSKPFQFVLNCRAAYENRNPLIELQTNVFNLKLESMTSGSIVLARFKHADKYIRLL